MTRTNTGQFGAGAGVQPVPVGPISTGAIPEAVQARNVNGFQINVEVTCQPLDQTIEQWKNDTYEVPHWKVSTVYNGVTFKNYDGGIAPAEVKGEYHIGPMDPTVLFSSRMVYQKGPDLLVEAIPAVLKFYPHAKFVFAGDGEMLAQVRDRAHFLGVGHATRFLGFQQNGRLTNLYKACDVLCVPSRNEPFGIVLLEAWSAGKPVVATNSGGPAEFVWHEVNGLKVYPDPNSIAWGLGTLFTNFEWGRWMGRNGRVAVETAFSWDHIADQVAGIYGVAKGAAERAAA